DRRERVEEGLEAKAAGAFPRRPRAAPGGPRRASRGHRGDRALPAFGRRQVRHRPELRRGRRDDEKDDLRVSRKGEGPGRLWLSRAPRAGKRGYFVLPGPLVPEPRWSGRVRPRLSSVPCPLSTRDSDSRWRAASAVV